MTITDDELSAKWHRYGARATAELLILDESAMDGSPEERRCVTLARLSQWDTHEHVRDGVRSYL